MKNIYFHLICAFVNIAVASGKFLEKIDILLVRTTTILVGVITLVLVITIKIVKPTKKFLS